MIKLGKYPAKMEKKEKLKNNPRGYAVDKLLDYMERNEGHGIYLCQAEEGGACLVFNPGLQGNDKEELRWTIARIIEGLYFDAADDLKELIDSKLITLPAASTHRPAPGSPPAPPQTVGPSSLSKTIRLPEAQNLATFEILNG